MFIWNFLFKERFDNNWRNSPITSCDFQTVNTNLDFHNTITEGHDISRSYGMLKYIKMFCRGGSRFSNWGGGGGRAQKYVYAHHERSPKSHDRGPALGVLMLFRAMGSFIFKNLPKFTGRDAAAPPSPISSLFWKDYSLKDDQSLGINSKLLQNFLLQPWHRKKCEFSWRKLST